MSDITILSALKFLAIAIALASTIWGMTREITIKDDEGRKRLAPAGHVAVALTLGASLVAAASYGFETVAIQADKRASVQAKEAEKAETSRLRQKQEADQNRRDILQAARANAEEIRDLRRANAQRDRDLALARTVNLRSAENLDRTQAALIQIQRLNHPIGVIRLTITWEIPANTPGLAEMTRRLAELAMLPSSEPGQPGATPGLRIVHGISVTVEPGSEFYSAPSGHADNALSALVGGLRAYANFRGHGVGLSRLNPDNDLPDGVESNVQIELNPPSSLRYHALNGSIGFTTAYEGTLNRDPRGIITSIPDLENSRLDVFLGEQLSLDAAALRMTNSIRPRNATLYAGNRSYSIGPPRSRFVPVRIGVGARAWRLNRLPPPD